MSYFLPQKHKSNNKDGKRQCSVCREWKPISREYFHYRNQWIKTLSSTCIKCVSIRTRERYRKSK